MHTRSPCMALPWGIEHWMEQRSNGTQNRTACHMQTVMFGSMHRSHIQIFSACRICPLGFVCARRLGPCSAHNAVQSPDHLQAQTKVLWLCIAPAGRLNSRAFERSNDQDADQLGESTASHGETVDDSAVPQGQSDDDLGAGDGQPDFGASYVDDDLDDGALLYAHCRETGSCCIQLSSCRLCSSKASSHLLTEAHCMHLMACGSGPQWEP